MLRIIFTVTALAMLTIITLSYITKKRDEEFFKKLSGKVLF